MMMVFISHPMGGLSVDEIKATRQRATKYIQSKYRHASIIDSWFVPIKGTDLNSVYWLGKSLEKMSDADLVYFCKGWENGRGCCIEHRVCELYGIPFEEEV